MPTIGPKALLAHDAHLVVDIGEHFRRKIGRAGSVGVDLHADMGRRALAQRLGLLLADEVGEARLRHRPERGRGVQRIADDEILRLGDEALDEFVIDLLVDIDALDAAAALAGIVEGAFDQIGDGMVELDVGQHIGRVLAAEFQAERHEGSRRGLFDRPPAGHRAGEVDMIDLAGAEQSFGLGVVQHDVLEDVLRQVGLLEGPGEALADQERLRGVLQDHRASRPSAPERSY